MEVKPNAKPHKFLSLLHEKGTNENKLNHFCHINNFSTQITHWHSPQFHGYFAAGNSYPSILGDMLSDAIGCIGFSWVSPL